MASISGKDPHQLDLAPQGTARETREREDLLPKGSRRAGDSCTGTL